jgi:ribosomal protein L11 methyltransferase
MSDSWKLTLPCTRAEAEAIEVDMGALALLEPPPVLMTSEVVDNDPLQWRLEQRQCAHIDLDRLGLGARAGPR